MIRPHARAWLSALLATLPLLAAGCQDAHAPAAQPDDPRPAAQAQVADGPAAASASTPVADATTAASRTPAVAAGTQNITFDTLKFPLTKNDEYHRSLLTSTIEALHGQPVRIRGYILPSFQQTGLTQFVLVRDNMQCCFGPGAALYDCVLVEMKPGKAADYTVRPVAVEGTFELRDYRDPDGKYLAIYHLDGDAVTF
ncbi:MAG: DUF3299 domain-containing protein [Planctomycetia bacterium]|nr:DUF3299 domain-containing protein [Planctomycetia bacterium]